MIVIDQDPHSKKVVRYRVYYKDEGIISHMTYTKFLERAKAIARDWREDDWECGIDSRIVNKVI